MYCDLEENMFNSFWDLSSTSLTQRLGVQAKKGLLKNLC